MHRWEFSLDMGEWCPPRRPGVIAEAAQSMHTILRPHAEGAGHISSTSLLQLARVSGCRGQERGPDTWTSDTAPVSV